MAMTLSILLGSSLKKQQQKNNSYEKPNDLTIALSPPNFLDPAKILQSGVATITSQGGEKKRTPGQPCVFPDGRYDYKNINRS